MLFDTITTERHSKHSLKHGAPVASQENMQRMHSFDHVHLWFFITFFEKMVLINDCPICSLFGLEGLYFSEK